MQPDTAWMVYQYQQHMREARGLNVKTIDARLRHIHQFVDVIDDKDLLALEPDDIILFKKDLTGGGSEVDRLEFSLAAPTIVQTLRDIGTFVEWLSEQPGYRKLYPRLADYCTPTNHLTALAHTPKDKFVPEPDEIRQVIYAMPTETVIQRRNRAVIAFLFLTGVRDGALVSFRLKHVDVAAQVVFQDAREVRTKFSKTMYTMWFPVGEDIEVIATDWISERRTSGANEDAPVFPSAPKARLGFGPARADHFWKTADRVRKIIREATKAAGVPYFRPHAVRSTLARMFDQIARTFEERKALSQNLGHEELRTTLQHYGQLDEGRQHEIIRDIRQRKSAPADDDLHDLLDKLPAGKRYVIKQVAKGFLES